MQLSSILSPEHVIMHLSSKTKCDAICELAGCLRGDRAVADFDAFVEAVLRREEEQTTGVGEGIALPHARTDSVREMVVALGVSREGIDWQAGDGLKSHLVFLMGVPSASVTEYIRFLARLTKTLCRAESRQILLAAGDVDVLLEALKGLESPE